jgi:hypothetical protein
MVQDQGKAAVAGCSQVLGPDGIVVALNLLERQAPGSTVQLRGGTFLVGRDGFTAGRVVRTKAPAPDPVPDLADVIGKAAAVFADAFVRSSRPRVRRRRL